jgi:hypothetical protein
MKTKRIRCGGVIWTIRENDLFMVVNVNRFTSHVGRGKIFRHKKYGLVAVSGWQSLPNGKIGLNLIQIAKASKQDLIGIIDSMIGCGYCKVAPIDGIELNETSDYEDGVLSMLSQYGKINTA